MNPDRYRYPTGPLYGDYARACAGLLLTGVPPLLLNMNLWVGLPMAGAAALFALFGARTAQRHATIVEVDEGGIVAHGPLGGSIRWEDLAYVRLNYYSTRRDRGLGWMQLTLKSSAGKSSAGATVRLESSLEGFDDIAEQVVEAARSRGIRMTDTTISNFAALGIDADFEPAAAETAPAKTWFQSP